MTYFDKIFKGMSVSFLYGVNRYYFANKDVNGNVKDFKDSLIVNNFIDGTISGVWYSNPLCWPINLIKLSQRIEISLTGKDKTKYPYVYSEFNGNYNYNTL